MLRASLDCMDGGNFAPPYIPHTPSNYRVYGNLQAVRFPASTAGTLRLRSLAWPAGLKHTCIPNYLSGFPKIRGTLFVGPQYNRDYDYSILRSIVGIPDFGKLPFPALALRI